MDGGSGERPSSSGGIVVRDRLVVHAQPVVGVVGGLAEKIVFDVRGHVEGVVQGGVGIVREGIGLEVVRLVVKWVVRHLPRPSS